MRRIFLLFAVMSATIFSRAQWEADTRLTYDPASSVTAMNCTHAMACSGDTIHVVWHDDRNGQYEIYYKRSVDKGLTWGPDTRLTNYMSNSEVACILVSGSTVHVSWAHWITSTNADIYYKRSLDGGDTWGGDIRLTNTSGNTWHPCIAITDSALHVVYYDYANNWWEIYYQRSTDNGSTWEQPVQLTNDPSASSWATVCAKNSDLHVVWYDSRNGYRQIYYKRSNDEGLTWGPDTQLTFTNDTSWYPCIAASESCIHVVWRDGRDGNSEIYYKRSCDGGDTWSSDTRLTNNSGQSIRPNMTTSGPGVFITWVDNTEGNNEIYFKSSMDEGVTWNPDTKLTNDVYESNHPFISVSGPQVNVIWNDGRDSNDEIYYKRNPTGGLPVGIEKEPGDTADNHVRIYPNPASADIHIETNNVCAEKSEFIILNILGEELFSGHIKDGKSVLDVSCIHNGIYYAVIKTANKQPISVKLVILK